MNNFKKILTLLEDNTIDNNKIEKLVKTLSPKTNVEISTSGRKITLSGPDGTAIIQQGIGDGKWRARYGSTVDEVTGVLQGIEYVMDWCDSAFNEKKFKQACSVAKCGEVED